MSGQPEQSAPGRAAIRPRVRGGPWWIDWRPGRRVEALVVALLIEGLTALTLAVGYRAYLAGLAALARPGVPAPWLFAPSEAGLVLLLGLAAGGWLAGVWLGERLGWGWGWIALAAAALSLPITRWLYETLGVSAAPARFLVAGLMPHELWPAGTAALIVGVMLGGLTGAWWSSLAPSEPDA